MSRVLDRRNDHRPGLHAFLCGVSHYAHLPGGGSPDAAERSFGLRQLSATATTVHRVYDWLLQADAEERLPLPLASVQLLLSPSATETAASPHLADPGASAATRRNFVRAARQWRDDASVSNDEMTFFYFAGHGVQRKQRDSVLLLEDFGDPFAGGPLVNTVDVRHLAAGMAPPRNPMERIARRQLYFIDACRMPVGEFQRNEWQNVPDLWPVELNGEDDRATPQFFASVPGSKAFALGGDQTLFSHALLRCLDRLGAVAPEADDHDPRYRVTTLSLIESLGPAIADLNDEHDAEQGFAIDGQLREVPVVFLQQRPEVDVTVTLDPVEAVSRLRVAIEDEAGRPAGSLDDPSAHPWQLRLRAGLYLFDALVQESDPPIRSGRKLAPVRLPEAPVRIEVQP